VPPKGEGDYKVLGGNCREPVVLIPVGWRPNEYGAKVALKISLSRGGRGERNKKSSFFLSSERDLESRKGVVGDQGNSA